LFPALDAIPLKKLDAQEETLLKLLHHWRNEAGQAGPEIKRIVVASSASSSLMRLVATASSPPSMGRRAPWIAPAPSRMQSSRSGLKSAPAFTPENAK
jgi:hypothetical protein